MCIGVKTLFITPGSPWENGYKESFNAKLRDELLKGEIFTSLREAQVLIKRWRQHANTVRPHSSLGYRPPASETILPPASILTCAPLQPVQTLANERRILTQRLVPLCGGSLVGVLGHRLGPIVNGEGESVDNPGRLTKSRWAHKKSPAPWHDAGPYPIE